MSHKVVLNWNASVDSVDGYNVYRGATAGQESTKLNNLPLTVTTFEDDLPLLGTSFYVAKSVVNGVESVGSNEVTVSLRPAAPTNLVATAS